MHWEKSPPTAAVARSRPYQGVRVRDPVKELLRRKRSLELHQNKTAQPPADVITHNSQTSYTPGIFGVDVAGGSPATSSGAVGDLQCPEWRATAPTTTAAAVATTTTTATTGLQPAMTPWSPSDYNQPDSSAQTLAYPAAPTLTADVYMQTLCPSYTMLTYTHTPLLTNFGTIPVGPAPPSLPQMELPDSGLAYFPWAQPLTTISTMPSSGVQFAPGSAALPGSPLVHMPLSMSLATMIPQLETPSLEPMPRSEHQLSGEPQELEEDPEVEPQSPNLLDKLLEDQKEGDEEEGKNSYSSSLFAPNI